MRYYFLQYLRESATAEVDKIMRTDAPLLFPPGQVLFSECDTFSFTHFLVFLIDL